MPGKYPETFLPQGEKHAMYIPHAYSILGVSKYAPKKENVSIILSTYSINVSYHALFT